jgi:hypothetical protein
VLVVVELWLFTMEVVDLASSNADGKRRRGIYNGRGQRTASSLTSEMRPLLEVEGVEVEGVEVRWGAFGGPSEH